MTYIPEKNLKKPIAICVICITLAVAFLILSALNIWNRLLDQIIMLICLVVFIELLTRYFYTEYSYELDVSGSESELSVIKKGGTRRMVVCKFGFSSFIDIKRNVKPSEMYKQYGKAQLRYNYSSNMFSQNTVQMYLIFNDKRVLVTAEADEAFYSALTAELEKAKQLKEFSEKLASNDFDSGEM